MRYRGKWYLSMSKRIKRSISVLVGLASVMTLFILTMHPVTAFAAETEEEVMLQQALDYFYKHNYDLLINKYEIDKASSDLKGAKLLPNPTMSFDYTGMDANRSLSAGNNTQSTFRVDQLIELSGKRALRTSVAQENLEAVRLSHQDLARNIVMGFYSLYFGLHLDILNLTLNQYALQQFDKSLDIAEKRFTAGFLSLVDYSKLKLARIDLENNIINAERQLKIDGEQLRLLIGIDKSIRPASGQLQGILPEYHEEDLLAKAYQNRKDLLALQRQLKSSEYNVSLAKAYRIPDVTVGAEYERFGPDREPGFGLGVSLPLPLFNRNQAEIAKRSAEFKQLELQITKAKRQIESDIRQALQNYLTARKVHDTYLNRKKDLEDLRERSEKSFTLGGITVLDFLDTQKTYREFMSKYNQAAAQSHLTHELLKTYTGEIK
jgi:cobalt-zinc-cadmium efflux system outer membrane protein